MLVPGTIPKCQRMTSCRHASCRFVELSPPPQNERNPGLAGDGLLWEQGSRPRPLCAGACHPRATASLRAANSALESLAARYYTRSSHIKIFSSHCLGSNNLNSGIRRWRRLRWRCRCRRWCRTKIWCIFLYTFAQHVRGVCNRLMARLRILYLAVFRFFLGRPHAHVTEALAIFVTSVGKRCRLYKGHAVTACDATIDLSAACAVSKPPTP